MRCRSSGSRSRLPRRSRWPRCGPPALRSASPTLALRRASNAPPLVRLASVSSFELEPPHWRTGMRVLALIFITLCTALTPAIAAAQDAAELRRQIEQYASAVVRIEAGEEGRGQETGVTLAEAYLTLLTLPFGTQARLGQVRNRFGWSNEVHEHDLPWVDRPNVMRNFLGREGLQEKGVELTLVPDLPFYIEALAGIFNGDNETAFGRGTLQHPLATGRLRTFFELADEHAILLGMSVASGQTDDRNRSTILGWEWRYKYRPDGWLHPLITLTGEALYSLRKADVGVDLDGDGTIDQVDKRQRNHWGWYTGLEVQPFRRWAGGVRYDWSQYPINPGWEWAIEPYVSFWPSEFLRFRLAYKHTDRSPQTRDAFNLNDSSARKVDELLFQASFILGAHPAHPF